MSGAKETLMEDRHDNKLYCVEKGLATVYYIPTYLAVVMKRMESFDFAKSTLTVRIQ